MSLHLRPAVPDDAQDLARLVNLAGEGLPLHLWAAMAGPGETGWDVGRQRALRDAGAFTWRNAVLAEAEGAVAGGLVTYRLAPDPQPLDGLPEAFQNLQALENLAPDSQYINVLAVYPAFRNRGIARVLLAEAARRGGGAPLSLIVADRNRPALSLYTAEGFAERARLPLRPPAGWSSDSAHWVLLTRLAGAWPREPYSGTAKVNAAQSDSQTASCAAAVSASGSRNTTASAR